MFGVASFPAGPSDPMEAPIRLSKKTGNWPAKEVEMCPGAIYRMFHLMGLSENRKTMVHYISLVPDWSLKTIENLGKSGSDFPLKHSIFHVSLNRTCIFFPDHRTENHQKSCWIRPWQSRLWWSNTILETWRWPWSVPLFEWQDLANVTRWCPIVS